MPQKCPCPNTNPLAQTVCLLQGGNVHPNFENQKKIFFGKKIFFASTTTRKIHWFHWWNPFLSPFTITGDICNFVTAMSALSNTGTSQRSVYDYARRPILCTGQHLLCSFSSLLLQFLQTARNKTWKSLAEVWTLWVLFTYNCYYLTCIFPGAVRTGPFKNFLKRVWLESRVSRYFWALNANSFKMVKAMDLIFDEHITRDSPDRTS